MSPRELFRILFVDTELVWRGGQEQLFTLIVGMMQRGHDVSLAAPAESPLTERARSRGIRCRPFRQRNEFDPSGFWKLRRILRERRFDIVHFNTPRSIVAGGLAARAAGVPLCLCSRRVNFPLRSFLSRHKYNLLLDGVVTVSDSIRQTLIDGGVREQLIEVIYEGVDLGWLDALGEPSLQIPNSGPIVGMVAHLSPEKGHRVLLQAAARLQQRYPKASYVLVGDGPLKPELEKEARRMGVQRQILFTGFRSDSEALMKKFDVFCLPSLSEGLSSAILAAMASRLPVIATRVGGIPELVVDGETGFLAPPDDPAALGAALGRLLESSELRFRLGAAGRRRIEERFTLSQKLDRSESLCLRLLRDREFR